MKFMPYPKIKQFSDCVRDVRHDANYKGPDEHGKPVFEESRKPTIRFKGTVKLHGTNAGICYTPEVGIRGQKRNSFLGDNPHFGFAKFIEDNETSLELLMQGLWIDHCNEDDTQITLFGEWAGDGVQKGVGISKLPKSFYIFEAYVYNLDADEGRFVDVDVSSHSKVININSFNTYSLVVDFNNPAVRTQHMVSLTESVENNCPVASALGESGIGEGIVWRSVTHPRRVFKVKGALHSVTKVKTSAAVDPEVLKSRMEFVDYACTSNRVYQGIQLLGLKWKNETPALMRWVANDIMSEESEALEASGLAWKDVAKECNNRVRQVFFAYLESREMGS